MAICFCSQSFCQKTVETVCLKYLTLVSQNNKLTSYTTQVVCFSFIHSWWYLQFIVNFWETFHGNFICPVSFCQKKSRKEIFFHISVCLKYLNWVLNHGLTSNKTMHFLYYTATTSETIIQTRVTYSLLFQWKLYVVTVKLHHQKEKQSNFGFQLYTLANTH